MFGTEEKLKRLADHNLEESRSVRTYLHCPRGFMLSIEVPTQAPYQNGRWSIDVDRVICTSLKLVVGVGRRIEHEHDCQFNHAIGALPMSFVYLWSKLAICQYSDVSIICPIYMVHATPEQRNVGICSPSRTSNIHRIRISVDDIITQG